MQVLHIGTGFGHKYDMPSILFINRVCLALYRFLFREIRDLSRASVIVERIKDRGWRLLRIEGNERDVEFAKHLIKIRLRLHEKSIKRQEKCVYLQEVKTSAILQTAATVLALNSDV